MKIDIKSLDGNAAFEGGSGNDTIAFTGSNFAARLDVELGNGTNSLDATNSVAADKAEFESGSGVDSFSFTGSSFVRLETEQGRGNDTLSIGMTSVTMDAEFDGEGGSDTFNDSGGNSLTNLQRESFETINV